MCAVVLVIQESCRAASSPLSLMSSSDQLLRVIENKLRKAADRDSIHLIYLLVADHETNSSVTLRNHEGIYLRHGM